ncbi:MAG TPA: hypothetical protein VFZ08_08820 [Terriglobia bacterium]|nr:hypothetical protein [Terriglobia bacterium]
MNLHIDTKSNIRRDFAGHSLRAGLATAVASVGVPERDIMTQTGHKLFATLRKYIREGSLFLKTRRGGWANDANSVRGITKPAPET